MFSNACVIAPLIVFWAYCFVLRRDVYNMVRFQRREFANSDYDISVLIRILRGMANGVRGGRGFGPAAMRPRSTSSTGRCVYSCGACRSALGVAAAAERASCAPLLTPTRAAILPSHCRSPKAVVVNCGIFLFTSHALWRVTANLGIDLARRSPVARSTRCFRNAVPRVVRPWPLVLPDAGLHLPALRCLANTLYARGAGGSGARLSQEANCGCASSVNPPPQALYNMVAGSVNGTSVMEQMLLECPSWTSQVARSQGEFASIRNPVSTRAYFHGIPQEPFPCLGRTGRCCKARPAFVVRTSCASADIP